jgi:hypothetical protein
MNRIAHLVFAGLLVLAVVISGVAISRSEAPSAPYAPAATSTPALGETLARLKPGQRAALTVAGSGGERMVAVTLGELPVE